MRIKDGFKLRSLAGEFIVVGEGLSQVSFNKLISLNETAAYLWKNLVDKTFDANDITKLLCEKYEVEEAVAAADAEKLVESWRNAGLLDE